MDGAPEGIPHRFRAFRRVGFDRALATHTAQSAARSTTPGSSIDRDSDSAVTERLLVATGGTAAITPDHPVPPR